MHRNVRRLLVGVGLVGATAFAGLATRAEAAHHLRSSAPAPLNAAVAPLPTHAGRSIPTDTTGRTTSESPNALSKAFRDAASSVLPAVVYVEVEEAPHAHGAIQNPFKGTPFEHMFPQQQMPQTPTMGSGSGFIFRPDGYIMTNNHVVDGAEKVTVVTQDRRQFEAKVVGRDPNTDVAVLKIDAKGLPVARLGNSDAVQVGDWVVALGYPLRLGATVTSGIISAKGRDIGILQQSDAPAPLEHYLQTDAAINPGNSGGPLVDLSGRVIGINSAIESPTGYYSGYGFAVPISLARRVAADLIRYGEVHRPMLGVQIKGVTPADADVYGLERPEGAVVAGIPDKSPAHDAGVQLGDVIVGLNGDSIQTPGDLEERVAREEPGQKVVLDIVRYGKHMQIPVKLGTFAPAVHTNPKTGETVRGAMDRLGFQAEPLSPEIAQRLGIEGSTEGKVVVSDVSPAGPAARAGLTPGMVIERFDGQAVTSTDQLLSAARKAGPDKAVSLLVRAPNGTETIINFLPTE